jgi:hypothetical protein
MSSRIPSAIDQSPCFRIMTSTNLWPPISIYRNNPVVDMTQRDVIRRSATRPSHCPPGAGQKAVHAV